MEVVIDIDTSDPERAALEFCRLLEESMPRARREVRGLLARGITLYNSGVRYRTQPKGAQYLYTPAKVYARKQGDCKQLILWRMAELREQGEPAAAPRILWNARTPGLIAHAKIRRADGTEECPSWLLGMKGL